MLIFTDKKFIKAQFENEAELEKVIIDNYEYLFGPSSIFLPKAKVKTADGVGTIPDGFAIDIEKKKWYLVEAELIHHGVWNHIAPQVTKQLLASQQPITRKIIVDLLVEQYRADSNTKEKFDDLNIHEINVRKIVGDILESDPIIGVPIDGLTNDLKDWTNTLKNKVILWQVNKFVEFNNPSNIVYEFPEEFKPEFENTVQSESQNDKREITKYDVGISDLISEKMLSVGEKLLMIYKPRNGVQKKYESIILENGSLQVLNQEFSTPTYAALAGIQDAGSTRQTVNGWTSWKTLDGRSLADLREHYLDLSSSN